MRKSYTPYIIALVLLIVGIIVGPFLLSNVETPAGYVGYIRRGALIGKSSYVGMQTGPTSTGLSWMINVQNISITPYAANEVWAKGDEVLAQDKLPIKLSSHFIWKINSEKVREFMEQYGGLDDHNTPDQIADEAYKNFLRPVFRNAIRDEVAKFKALDINDNLALISKEVLTAMRVFAENTPFIITSATIGTCVVPEAVTIQTAAKVAATQQLETKATELLIAEKALAIQRATGEAEAAKEVAIAKGKGEAMDAINKHLTPNYVRYLEVMNLAGAQRVYVPFGANIMVSDAANK